MRVFVVEDSAIIRQRIVSDVGSLAGTQVVGVAESQDEAIGMIAELCPDVIVTDLQLKEGSGMEVVRQVRANARVRRPQIFVLTNYALPEYQTRCLSAGADAFFDKTSEYDRFLSLCRQESARVSGVSCPHQEVLALEPPYDTAWTR